MEFQSGLFEPFLYRSYEAGYIGVTRTFGGVEFFLDHVVSVVLQIFERQVLQLAFQLIESELVGEWSIEIAGLFTHFATGISVGCVAYLSHEIHTVGDHD